MKIVECRGNDREIGEAIGEDLRSEIQQHIAHFVRDVASLTGRIRFFVESTASYLPGVMEQLKGIAWGARVREEEIFALNLPSVGQVLSLAECSNIVFQSGPAGPLWGKTTMTAFRQGSSGGRSAC
ncbi:MAG TPA: hypothetical protein PKW42_00835 [bacterium]|nr:hypothetical protein [bacterium]